MFETLKANRKFNKLIKEWESFRGAVLRPGATTPVTPAEEERFLELKARVASLIPLVSETAPRSIEQEAREQAQTMTSLLNRYERLDNEHLKTNEERKKFEHYWHRSHMFLHKLKAMRVEPEKPKPRRPGPAAPTGMPSRKVRGRGIPGAGTLRFAVRLALVVVALVILGRAFGLRWEDNKFSTAAPSSFGEFLSSLGDTFGSAGTWVTGRLSPVVDVYGLEVTIVLVAALLLAIGYFVFIRGR